MSTAIEAAILKQLMLLDNDRKTEVFDFIRALTAKADASASRDQIANELDPMRYSGAVSWPVDGLAYQERLRGEWE